MPGACTQRGTDLEFPSLIFDIVFTGALKSLTDSVAGRPMSRETWQSPMQLSVDVPHGRPPLGLFYSPTAPCDGLHSRQWFAQPGEVRDPHLQVFEFIDGRSQQPALIEAYLEP
jgi:hypothetical protein